MRRIIRALLCAALVGSGAPGPVTAANGAPVAVDDPAVPGCNPQGAFGGSFPIAEDPRTDQAGIPKDWFALFGTCSPLVNDTDPDGDPLTLELVGQPSHGQAQWLPEGFLLYKPDADWSTPWGDWVSDAVQYRVSDGTSWSNVASYRFWLAPVNDPPTFTPGALGVEATVGDGAVSTPWATAISAGPANESGQAVSFVIESVVKTTSGMFAVSPTIDDAGTLHFTPGSVPGMADVTVHAQDDGGLEDYGLPAGSMVEPDDTSAATTFSITVREPDPAAPTAVDDELTVPEDQQGELDVLANDSDVNQDGLTVTAVGDPQHGVASVSATPGHVEYAPAADFHGADSFTYTVDDGTGRSATATIQVVVTSVNDAPVAANDEATVVEGTGGVIAVLDNDDDVDGDPLVVASVTQPAHGAASVSGDGVGYSPAPGYVGPDTVTYTASDGHGGADTASVSVTVVADSVGPAIGGLTTSIPAQVVGTASVKVQLRWTASDAGVGIATQILEERIGTGAWHTIDLTSTTRTATRRVAVGTEYRYRVIVVDARGNRSVGTWPVVIGRLRQESSSSITRSGAWTLVSDARYSGGATRRTTSTAARATFTFSGRNVAWVATRSSTGGRAEVRIDGVLVATVSLRSSTRQDRVVVFTRRLAASGSHTLSIRPIGGRVDIDAFVTLP